MGQAELVLYATELLENLNVKDMLVGSNVIIGKLLYYAEGGSEKHIRDIVGMLQVSEHLIDRDDVTMWATKLNVNQIWVEILKHVD